MNIRKIKSNKQINKLWGIYYKLISSARNPKE